MTNTSSVQGAGPTDPWKDLGEELARIRGCLEREHEYRVAQEVWATELEVSEAKDESGDARTRLRQRVGQLIGILTPAAQIIGGVAALEAIVQHL